MMAENRRSWAFLPLVPSSGREQARRMLLITCPVTGSRELIGITAVLAVANHRDRIEVTVACPCGGTHVHVTGRRVQEARAAAALEVAVRRAETLTPA
jgi:hypothetical protein